MTTSILRLKRTDKSGEYLLLHITQTTSSKNFNLKLIATEHEHLYHAQIQDSSLKSLQANTYTGDLQEWKAVLKYALLHEQPPSLLPEAFQGLETVAAISGTTVTITLRKNIDGIIQRVGSIKLNEDDEKEEVSAFEWVDSAVSSSDALRAQLETLQTSVTEQRDHVERLTQQLDDLVKAKREHEEEMLMKFAVLINAKKLKIRDQQRLLVGAKIDLKAAEAVRGARHGSGRQAGVSRGGKRKGGEVEDADDDGEDEAEVGEVDEDGEERQETPPRSADEATDEEKDLDGPLRANGNGNAKAGRASKQTDDVEMDEAPPPRRELPFQKSSAQQSAKKAEPAADDEDDETDDEL